MAIGQAQSQGPKAMAFFSGRGVRATNTAGYEPNANRRVEGGIGLINIKVRVLPTNLGPPGRQLWPAAIQHACWAMNGGAEPPRRLVPVLVTP